MVFAHLFWGAAMCKDGLVIIQHFVHLVESLVPCFHGLIRLNDDPAGELVLRSTYSLLFLYTLEKLSA